MIAGLRNLFQRRWSPEYDQLRAQVAQYQNRSAALRRELGELGRRKKDAAARKTELEDRLSALREEERRLSDGLARMQEDAARTQEDETRMREELGSLKQARERAARAVMDHLVELTEIRLGGEGK